MAVETLDEISEQTSSEEVKAYAEQVVKEVEADRAGEKSDAQIVSETAGKPAPQKQAAETSSGSKAAPKGDDTAKADSAEVEDQSDDGWMDDDLKAELAAYGVDESDLSDFASREEVERALRLFDKSAIEAGRKALADGPDRNAKGQFAKKSEESKEEPEPAPLREGRYEVTLDKDVYDDEIIAEFTRLRDHYDARLEALESRHSETEAEAKERHFDSLVDSLNHEDLFGKTDKETAEEKSRREDLFVEVETYLRGRAALGRPAELNEAIVGRIARSLFANEIGKKELKQRTRKITRQSNIRLGGGATRPQDPREDPRDEADRLYRELERG